METVVADRLSLTIPAAASSVDGYSRPVLMQDANQLQWGVTLFALTNPGGSSVEVQAQVSNGEQWFDFGASDSYLAVDHYDGDVLSDVTTVYGRLKFTLSGSAGDVAILAALIATSRA